jgi:cysteinyl-tRNA synthetase
MKHLGEDLDIHCGGIDNAFPHHTNEIAQSESFLGHKWCNYWMHVLHLNTTDGKMSKSKGEFLTVSLLEDKGYDPLSYRLFCLQSHYRKSLVFNWENLDNAQKTYDKLIGRVAALSPKGEAIDEDIVKNLRERFDSALGNDLNTSLAVTSLYDVLKANTNDDTKLKLIADFDSVLGLDLIRKAEVKRELIKKQTAASGEFTVISEDGTSDPSVEAKIRERQDAKKAKDYARADAIREELKASGIEVTDIPHGVRWKRI